MNTTLTRRISLLFFICIAAATLHAAFPSSAPFLLDIGKMKERAAGVTHEKYPEAHLALIDDMQYTRYEADGTSISWDDMAYKVLTEKGKEDMKTLSMHYTKSYTRAAMECLELYKADGHVVKLPLETSEMTDPSQMRSNIYNPNQKVITVNVPDLEVGDTIRYRTRRETFKPRCPNTFSDYYILESPELLVNYTIIIDGPAELPLRRIAVRDPVGETVKSSVETLKDGSIRHRWDTRNVPTMHPEPKMPSTHTVAQRLMVSTIDTWEDVSRWYWNLCKPHLATTPEMAAKVKELTTGLTKRDDIIAAVFKFVSQEVRYMGITIEDEAPGYEPHDVSLTFNNRHGVCRDKAALLAAMLTLGGVEAFPVLIKAGDKMDAEIIQPYFNHAVTAALGDNGEYILMDSTDENTKELFPAYLANKSYLVAREKGETLKTTPFSPVSENMMIIRSNASVDAAGTLEVSSHLDFNGINDNAYRGTFANMSQEERTEFITRSVKRITPGARLTKLTFSPSNMLDTTKPLVIDFAFAADHAFVTNGVYSMLSLPYVSGTFGMNNFILRATSLDKRKYPLVTRYTCGIDEVISLDINPACGKPVVLPKFADINDECILWQRTVGTDDASGRLSVKTRFDIKVAEFTPAQYLKLKESLKLMEDNSRKALVLKTSKDTKSETSEKDHDIELLDQTVVYHLNDANSWTCTENTRLKVLTYKGKKENAELSYSYYPLTQTVTVDMAQVRNIDKKTGEEKIQKVSQKEMNVMDAEWVAQAPRYPARKMLIVSLPGVEIGSIIELKVTTVCKEGPPFFIRETFRRFSCPVRQRTVVVNAPTQLKLTTAVFQNGVLANSFDQAHQNNITETFVSENNRAIWTWKAQNQASLPEEPEMPSLYLFTPTVSCSAGNWPKIVQELKTAFESKSVSGEQVKKVAEGLKAKTKEEQLKGVNAFVDRSLNSVGPFFASLPLRCLTAPDTTITEGYGHGADCAIVAFALLKELGFSPEYVFAGPASRDDVFKTLYGSPSTGLFGRVRVRVVHDGVAWWFNDQNQYADIRTCDVENCHALTLDGKVSRVSVPPAFSSQRLLTYDIKLHDDGAASLSLTSMISGTEFGGRAKYYAELTPEYRRRDYLGLLKNLSQRATASTELVTDFSQYPGKLSFGCTIPQFAVVDGDFLYCRLPVESFKALPMRLLENRQMPFAHGGFNNVTLTVNITLPPSFRNVVMAPESYEWQAPEAAGNIFTTSTGTGSAKYQVTTVQGDGKLTLVYHAELVPETVFPEQFPVYDALAKKLTHAAVNTLLLKR